MATIATMPGTLADVVRRLGGVPLDRIRARPAPGTATEDDLLKAGKPICELIDGVLVEKTVGDRESLLSMYLGRLIGNHVEPNELGVLLGPDGYIRIDDDKIRAPDVTFIPWSSFPEGDLPEKEAYWSVAPGLVVEILSPNNTRAEIDRKLREFFSIGAKLAWVIDPETKAAKVYTSPKRSKEYDKNGVLDGGKILPGFKLALGKFLAAGEPRKKKPR